MPYAAEQDAKDAYAGRDANPARLKAIMGAAAGMVRRAAPAPDPVPNDYTELAASAEIVAGEYLWHTGGFLKRDTLLDSTTEFGTSEGVESAVASIMGPYARGESSSGGASYTLGVESTFSPTSFTDLPTP